MKVSTNGRPNLQICYGKGDSPIGPLWVVWTVKGLRELRLAHKLNATMLVQDLRHRHPGAEVQENQKAGQLLIRQVNQVLAGKRKSDQVRLDLEGTPFQQRVWQELLRVPWGQTCSYRELAQRVGRPRAVRAVANACGRNPVALVVPCHRILRSDGSLGGYYWGLECKQKLLQMEKVKS